MLRLFHPFARYRPRLLTLALLAAAALLIALANLSADYSLPEIDPFAFGHKSYGWPLIWHRYVICYPNSLRTVGWYPSYSRLAMNVPMWLLLLGVPAGMCEWLLRRHRLRMQWGLRAMLIAVGLIGLGMGWFVAARDRANVEDAIIAAINDDRGRVWVERRGPQWLDLFGVDRYRRHIAGVSIEYHFGERPDDPVLLKQIARLRDLRHLCLKIHRWTPDLGLTDALSAMPRLRSLSINGATSEDLVAVGKMSRLERLGLRHTIDTELCTCLERLPSLKSLVLSAAKGDELASHRFLATVGKLKNLKELCLRDLTIHGPSLACLAELNQLKLLSLSDVSGVDENADGILLGNLPPLPRLESLDLQESKVYDGDLCRLAALPRLKSLSLAGTWVTEAAIAELARQPSLEDLSISGGTVSPSGLAKLAAIERLRSVHISGTTSRIGRSGKCDLVLDDPLPICVWYNELKAFRGALQVLRQSKTGIRIDSQAGRMHHMDMHWFRANWGGLFCDALDPLPNRHSGWSPATEWPALGPSGRADFQKMGGWARFDAAGWGPNGPTTKF